MDLKHVEKLLENYYDGETSIEDEKMLSRFFAGPDIPEKLKTEQIKFLFLQRSAKEETTWQFDERVARALREKADTPNTKRLYVFVSQLTSIAAIVLLFAGISIFMYRDAQFNKKYAEAESTRVAFEQSKKALLLISEKLNKGNSNLTKIAKLNEVEETINKNK